MRIQILDEAVCISHGANTRGKSVNSIILPSAMNKQLVRLFNLAMATSQGEWKLN